ncbi:MAG: hypothetical protein AAFP70_06125 [Calditrichota bacterium]
MRITDAGAVDLLLNMFPLIKSDVGYADIYTFAPDDSRYPLFFIRYKKPVKDDPKYLYHWNGAERLAGITVCKNWWEEQLSMIGPQKVSDLSGLAEKRLSFNGAGSILLMPQRSVNKECKINPIIGITIHVNDLAKTEEYLKQRGIENLTLEYGTVFIRFLNEPR